MNKDRFFSLDQWGHVYDTNELGSYQNWNLKKKEFGLDNQTPILKMNILFI